MNGRGLWIAVFTATVFISISAYGQVFVSNNGDDTTGDSWATALSSLSAAVQQADDTDQEVWIASGTFTIPATVNLPTGAGIFGGFPPSGDPIFEDRDPEAFPTVLDGANATLIFLCDAATNVTIDGLTLTRGLGTEGGGLSATGGSTLTVSECIFSNNEATVFGGGIHLNDSIATILDSEFRENLSAEAAALMLFQASATVERCLFADNDGGSQGGAILTYESPLTLNRCIFKGNSGARGGAVTAREGTATEILNSLFVNNMADDHGAGINFESATGIDIANCTFVDNIAGTRGGGIFFHSSSGSVINSIFVNNNNHAIYENDSAADPLVENCLFFNNTDGVYFDEATDTIDTAEGPDGINTLLDTATANIDGDPIFVHPAEDDYHLRPESPAIDAGTDIGAPSDDIDGEDRPAEPAAARGTVASFDIGFDEFLDSDGDAMPDYWETLFGLNPNSSTGLNGADGDPDGDGVTNAQEFANNTDPRSGFGGGGGGSSGLVGFSCFIATAAYGTPLAQDLDTLRAFRDRHLLTCTPGAIFADGYYRLSPPLAQILARHPRIASAVRVPIAATVKAIQAPFLMVSLMAVTLALIRLTSHRRRRNGTRQ